MPSQKYILYLTPALPSTHGEHLLRHRPAAASVVPGEFKFWSQLLLAAGARYHCQMDNPQLKLPPLGLCAAQAGPEPTSRVMIPGLWGSETVWGGRKSQRPPEGHSGGRSLLAPARSGARTGQWGGEHAEPAILSPHRCHPWR